MQDVQQLQKIFFWQSYRLLNKNYIQLLKTFDSKCTLKNIQFAHTIGDAYIYSNSDISSLKETGVFCIGHSHEQFDIHKSGLRVINPGSLGQNRKKINNAEYLVMVIQKNTFNIEFKNFIYDTSKIIKKMFLEGYSKDIINYYINKL